MDGMIEIVGCEVGEAVGIADGLKVGGLVYVGREVGENVGTTVGELDTAE